MTTCACGRPATHLMVLLVGDDGEVDTVPVCDVEDLHVGDTFNGVPITELVPIPASTGFRLDREELGVVRPEMRRVL